MELTFLRFFGLDWTIVEWRVVVALDECGWNQPRSSTIGLNLGLKLGLIKC